jgi:flagellar hook assembly protein FlgD
VNEQGECFFLRAIQARNYPNPFNPSTVIHYTVSRSGPVCITVFAISGQAVKTLVDTRHEPGSYAVSWDGTDNVGEQAGSGMYLYHVYNGGLTATGKMTLIR